MKFLVPLIFIVSIQAHSTWWPPESRKTGTAVTLLNCNIQGPDQQVTVVRDRERLILKELTGRGRWIERDLTATEWDAKILRLQMGEKGEQTELDARDPFYYVLQYDQEIRRWTFDYRVPGWRQLGMADCW